MRSVRWAATAMMLAAAAAGNGTAQARTGTHVVGYTTSNSVSRVVSATDGLGFRLLGSLLRSSGNGNVFISPTSVAMALDMAYDGARGSTRTAMASTLGLGTMNAKTVRQRAGTLISDLKSNDSSVTVALANSLWARKGTSFQKQFAQDARKNYGAKVQTLDFNTPSAPVTINRWVSSATRGTIGGIITRIPPQTMLYLINAVYFKGDWSTAFNPRDTHQGTFTAGEGTSISIPMMHITGTFPYYAGSDFSMISVPYGQKRYSMVILLPRSGESLDSMRSRLNTSSWNGWVTRLAPQHGSLALPRFSLTNTYDLTSTLARLGMGTAFSNSADFSGMCTQPCKLSEVRHKTFLDVYEQGTTAAAATSVGVAPTAIQVDQFKMVVDHPFFLAIRDNDTGTLLFLGGVNAPHS